MSLEKEYFVCKLLQGQSAIPKVESQLIAFLSESYVAIYGYVSDKFFISFEHELTIRHTENKFEVNEVKAIFYNLTETLAEAELNNIYHGPITLQNVVRTFDMGVKLIDWGQEYYLENTISVDGTGSERTGSSKHLCSTQKNRHYYDTNVMRNDIYSLGKFIFKLITNKTYESESSMKELKNKISDDDPFFNIIGDILKNRPRCKTYF